MTDDEIRQTPNLTEATREMAYQIAGAALGIALRDNPDYEMPTREAGEETERILRDFGVVTSDQEEKRDD